MRRALSQAEVGEGPGQILRSWIAGSERRWAAGHGAMANRCGSRILDDLTPQRRPARFDVSQTPFWSDEYRAIKGRSPGRRRLHWRSLKVSAGVVAIECGVLIAIET